MLVTAQLAQTPYRLQRTFKWETYIILQVRQQNINVIISHDAQGALAGILSLFDVSVAGGATPDGLLFTAGSTSPISAQGPTNAVPYDFFWQGELWYAVDIAPAAFSLEMGTETSQRR